MTPDLGDLPGAAGSPEGRQIRACAVTGRRVVITAGRPPPLPAPVPARAVGDCPLCPGGVAQSAKELWRSGDPWRVRVVPDGLPRLGVEGDPAWRGGAGARWRRM